MSCGSTPRPGSASRFRSASILRSRRNPRGSAPAGVFALSRSLRAPTHSGCSLTRGELDGPRGRKPERAGRSPDSEADASRRAVQFHRFFEELRAQGGLDDGQRRHGLPCGTEGMLLAEALQHFLNDRKASHGVLDLDEARVSHELPLDKASPWLVGLAGGECLAASLGDEAGTIGLIPVIMQPPACQPEAPRVGLAGRLRGRSSRVGSTHSCASRRVAVTRSRSAARGRRLLEFVPDLEKGPTPVAKTSRRCSFLGLPADPSRKLLNFLRDSASDQPSRHRSGRRL